MSIKYTYFPFIATIVFKIFNTYGIINYYFNIKMKLYNYTTLVDPGGF